MATGIYAFGHGGGVPGPIPGTPVGSAGNTNFAIVPNLDMTRFQDPARFWMHNGKRFHAGVGVAELLTDQPFWLIDCGPETMLRICGVLGDEPVARNLMGVLLTHCHDDHSGGIKSLAYRCKFIEGTRPVLAYPQDLAALVQAQTRELEYMNPKVIDTAESPARGLAACFALHSFTRSDILGAEIQPGPFTSQFTIGPFPVAHNCLDAAGEPFPAFGYRLVTSGGTIITFSGDTAFPIDYRHLHESDVIVHDVQFYNDGSKGDQVHCPWGWLSGAVPPGCRSKVMLTHTGHDLPPDVEEMGFQLWKGGTLLIVD